MEDRIRILARPRQHNEIIACSRRLRAMKTRLYLKKREEAHPIAMQLEVDVAKVGHEPDCVHCQAVATGGKISANAPYDLSLICSYMYSSSSMSARSDLTAMSAAVEVSEAAERPVE